MGLQEQIAEAIVIAFDELGGDPQNAVNAAMEHDTVESWLQQETTKIAVAGGIEMAIPGLHALTIPAGSTTASITVNLVADGVAEPNETVIVTMGTPTNAIATAPTTHTLTIAAQTPNVSWTAASQSVGEGVGTATISASLSQASTQAVTVPFTVTGTANNPADYTIKELAGTTVRYDVTVKAIRKRVVPDLDDEFAKDLGEFESLSALRARVRTDLQHEAAHEAEREVRGELLKQLSTRVQFDVPASLLNREIDRRVEEFVRRLMEQQIDPMQTNINWEEFRERQREGAAESVRSALVLDEIARRENVSVSDEELDAEVNRYAERTGRTAATRDRERHDHIGHRTIAHGVHDLAGHQRQRGLRLRPRVNRHRQADHCCGETCEQAVSRHVRVGI